MPNPAIADNIPVDRAWREGRRIYVRCGYQSRLNTDLREIGATWDREVGCLWVGSGKLAAVVPLIEATMARAAAIEATKAEATTAGRWLAIPYDAAGIRGQAKALGARWDADRKQWAFPSDEALTEVRALVSAYQAQIEAGRQADAKARSEAAVSGKADAAECALAGSGRTSTGETASLREISTARYNRATAQAAARAPGSVITLKGGRRGVITSVEVWFTNSDMASSVCWHPQTHDEAHWDWAYEVAIVEPTADEIAADEAEAARLADEAELAAVVQEIDAPGGGRAEWSPVAGPTITRTSGSHDDGRIILDGDRIVWQHPGYYDDYRRTERESSDPVLVARVRALIDRGPRVVGRYTVKTQGER